MPTSKLHQSLRPKAIALAILSLWIFSTATEACQLTTTTRDATPTEISDFFVNEEKAVLTFVGYSGAEYQDKEAMLAKAAAILDEFDPATTIVNIGATPSGIGAVYELAKRRGFQTTGIVSTQAKEHQAELSACVDYVFFVKDATWGGLQQDSNELSPTSAAMVKNSDLLIGIGGGEVARDELMAARVSGKEVRFIPADMNHKLDFSHYAA